MEHIHLAKVATAIMSGFLLIACQTTSEPPVSSLDATSSGRIFFESSNTQELRDESGNTAELREPVVVSGKLDFPYSASGRKAVPAIVTMHGSGGTVINQEWIRRLNEAGVATFQIDSFSGRGATDVIANHGGVRTTEMIVDAYKALKLLATHPNIDSQRIGLMGFSKGGIVTQWALSNRRRHREVSTDLMFALHMPVYPLCLQYEDFKPTGAPIYIIAGEKDNWTPPKPCFEFVEDLAANGYPAKIDLIKDAHHGFDRVEQGVEVVEKASGILECEWVMKPNGAGPLDSYERNSGLPAYTVQETERAFSACANTIIDVKVGATDKTREAAFSKGLSFIEDEFFK